MYTVVHSKWMQTISDYFSDTDWKESVHPIYILSTEGMLTCSSKKLGCSQLQLRLLLGWVYATPVSSFRICLFFCRSQTSELNRDMRGNTNLAFSRSLGVALLSVIFPWIRCCFDLLSWRRWGRMQFQRLPLDLLHYFNSFHIDFQFIYLGTGELSLGGFHCELVLGQNATWYLASIDAHSNG